MRLDMAGVEPNVNGFVCPSRIEIAAESLKVAIQNLRTLCWFCCKSENWNRRISRLPQTTHPANFIDYV